MITKTNWSTVISILIVISTLVPKTDAKRRSSKPQLKNGVLTLTVGDTFEWSCNISKVPKDKPIEWFFDGKKLHLGKRIKIKNHNILVVSKATLKDCGVYECRANISNELQTSSIKVQSTVTIRPKLPKTRNHVEGETLNLTCFASGSPKPNIYWLKDNVPVTKLTNSRLKVISNSPNSSTLIVRQLEETDRGNYTCTAQNPASTVHSSIIVRIKDKLAALWPFLGIVAEVSVLCTIIFIYEKRRAKPELEESDSDDNADRKVATESKDLRQRKN